MAPIKWAWPRNAWLLSAIMLAPLVLSACGTLPWVADDIQGDVPGSFPRLSDMPKAPEGVTSEEERLRIIDALKNNTISEPSHPEKSGTDGRGPAVPLSSLFLESIASLAAEFSWGQSLQFPVGPHRQYAQLGSSPSSDASTGTSMPSLRGTLKGEWRRPAVARKPISAPLGVTAAIPQQAKRGVVRLAFPAGLAHVGQEATNVLQVGTEKYGIQRGATVSIHVRGGNASTQAHGSSLTSFSLGLQRAAALADILIAAGMSADRIKIAAQGQENVSALDEKEMQELGADEAIIVFELP